MKSSDLAHIMTPEEAAEYRKSLIGKCYTEADEEQLETRGRPPERASLPTVILSELPVEARNLRLAKAAGIVEARGNLILQGAQLRYNIRSKNLPMLRFMRKLFGGSVFERYGSYDWNISGRKKVYEFLQNVTPYLTKVRRDELTAIMNGEPTGARSSRLD